VTSSICSTAAILSTAYRLYVRRSKLWIDDACAFCSMLALCAQICAVFTPLTASTGVARYYVMITAFYVIVWFSRLSILFSLIRIDPSKLRRKILLNAAVLFLLVCAFLIAQLFWTCQSQESWRSASMPQCSLTRQVAITQLVFNTFADLSLLVIPFQLLVVLQDRWLKSRLMIIFSTCTIATMVSMVHAIFILTLHGPEIVIVALVESTVSIIVCNVPVIATAVLHLGGRSTPRPASNNSNTPLNTVQFLSYTPSYIPSIANPATPPMAHYDPRVRTISTRPSSMLLKPEEPHLRPSLSGR
ncbi:hypothetical protein FA15DRAFT_597262, partial [Coprinopsis marcescibilis]